MKIIFLVLMIFSVSFADFARDDEMVIDTCTDLIWQDDSTPPTMSWANALKYCDALTLGGNSDWRLPNINELRSIVDYTTYNPVISSVFVNTFPNYYWSSTTDGYFTAFSWIVYFGLGGQRSYSKINKNYVRCVRSRE